MTITEILQSVQFVIDRDGKPTAAVLNMEAWESFLSALEDIEDTTLVRERLRNWPNKAGWTRWEEFIAEESDALPAVGPK